MDHDHQLENRFIDLLENGIQKQTSAMGHDRADQQR